METYNLLELANVHEGNLNYVLNTIKEFENVEANGIKFQVLHPDKIALPDFAWYNVYQQLMFDTEQWGKIISEAKKTKHVWIDVFDDYSFEISSLFLKDIYGFKFQASILFNKALVKKFGTINLGDKVVIINISGIPENEIENYIHEFENTLKPKELVLQIGFQGYPTQLSDSGLCKINHLRKKFNKRISFADHIDATHEDSKWLPVFAALQGIWHIEKHIKLTGTTPKYDFYSALDKPGYIQFLDNLKRYLNTVAQPFFNASESKYLTNTIQIPILTTAKKSGQLISIENDLSFKRSNQKGIRTDELKQLLDEHHILGSNKKENDVLHLEDFKKANIATIIACRLKSTRLPRKATAKIGNLSSVELCIKNALKFRNINHTILATSNLEEDADLMNYTYSPQVIFHKGHPEDVIKRYLDIIDTLKIDVIVRVTADMQYVSNDILQILLKSHFETGADYTSAVDAAIGTNLEIINTQALRYVKSFFPNANYSEYMTWYFKNNPEHFKLNMVNLPPEFVRDYRLTLDYQEDFDLFVKIEEHFAKNNLEYSITELYKFLDENPEIANINKGLIVKYRTDQTLIDTLNRETKIPVN